MYGNDGVWVEGSKGIQGAFLTLGQPNVGSVHMGMDNVFIVAVGHDLASRIDSRQTLWIPTIETRDFQAMHELYHPEFTAKSLLR
jgi:hypothetical protein